MGVPVGSYNSGQCVPATVGCAAQLICSNLGNLILDLHPPSRFQQDFPGYRSPGWIYSLQQRASGLCTGKCRMLSLGEASTAHGTHLPITTNHHLLPSKHHIRGPLQAGGQRETCVGISQAQNQVKAAEPDLCLRAAGAKPTRAEVPAGKRVGLTHPGWIPGSSTGYQTSAW